MKSLKVNIVTPEKIAWEADAVSVVLPGLDGYLGVWADHAPLVTGLVPGVITIRLDDSGHTKLLACSGGFVEISHNNLNIMSDTVEDAGEIDNDRARAALKRAKDRLAEAGIDESIDRERAQLALERAEARLKVLDLMDR